MKTIFTNDRGVSALHIIPETDSEREQLRNITDNSKAERALLRQRLKIRKSEQGITVSKVATLTPQVLEAGWSFTPVGKGPGQFTNTNYRRILSSYRHLDTILVGNGTYNVYRNVGSYELGEDTPGEYFGIVGMEPLNPLEPIRKFTCQTVEELERAMAWHVPAKK